MSDQEMIRSLHAARNERARAVMKPHPYQEYDKSKVQVFVIKNQNGCYYTGNMPAGLVEFSPKREDAIELDAEEAREEMDAMPQGADAECVLEHEFPASCSVTTCSQLLPNHRPRVRVGNSGRIMSQPIAIFRSSLAKYTRWARGSFGSQQYEVMDTGWQIETPDGVKLEPMTKSAARKYARERRWSVRVSE